MRALLALAVLPLAAAAQVSGPAVPSCSELGERQLRQQGFEIRALEIDNDRHLFLDRGGRKLGAQSVAAVLSGYGAIVPASGPPTELAFVCLLAGDKRALWFHWLPRRDAAALGQCRRVEDTTDCLQRLHETAERDLVEVSALRFQESLDADAKAGTGAASSAYRNAAAAWREYRDLECARRGAPGSEAWRACRVDLTRRRYLDLQ